MINLKQDVNIGFVEIRFNKKSVENVYGAKITYSVDDKKTFNNCAIYPTIEYDGVLYESLWSWNEAVNYGNVKFNGKPNKLWWNLYLNSIHNFTGDVVVKTELVLESKIAVVEQQLSIVPVKTVYFTDWQSVIPKDTPWFVYNNCLMIEPAKIVDSQPFAPAKIRPNLTGKYRIYFGIPSGEMCVWAKLSDDVVYKPFTISRSRIEYSHKVKKEVFYREVVLTKDTEIALNMIPHGVRNSDLCPFGRLAYLKFVPVKTRQMTINNNVKWKEKKLAVYFEPFSWAYVYGLKTKPELTDILKEFKSIGVDEVHTQVMRFGSKSLHKSKIMEPPADVVPKGDDKRGSPGPVEMRKSLDVLKETIDTCSSLGLFHYTNIGLTNCYPGTPGEDRISREHPEWRTGNILRFDRLETINYAANIVDEIIVDYKTPGISIDCLR